jgi:hypothetical protein
MAYRILTDNLGLVHHMPKRIENAHLTTAAVHRSWAAYWNAHKDIYNLADANMKAALAAEQNDKHAYNQVIQDTGITAFDFLWRRQLSQQQAA